MKQRVNRLPKRLPKRRKRKVEVQAKPLFSKILIANRGEIACRIIRTCQRMGIKTVAVYSDADISSLHVRMADEAVHIGKSPAAESYLNARAIIRAARRSGAEAIHPGYGFLSENAAFVNACQKAGLVFIGPSAEVMDSMKDKVQARRLAQEAGLPLLPGSEGVVKDDEAMAIAEEIGFPVMVKSASGGGGIGIPAGAHAAGAPRRPEAVQGSLRQRLWRFRRLHRKISGTTIAHRGPGASRQPRRRRSPL